MVYILLFFSLKIFCIMFFSWPQVFFENMIFRLRKILQNFYLSLPFSFVSIWRYLSCCQFPWIKAVMHFFAHWSLWASLIISSDRFPKVESLGQTTFMLSLLKNTATLPFRKTEWSALLQAVCIFPHPAWVFPRLHKGTVFKDDLWGRHHPLQVRGE